jgi:CBS domain-containing protein
MTRNIITQTGDQNVQAVSRAMYEINNNIGSIIIVKNKDRNNDVNKPVGIITERDIVLTLGLQQPALLKVSTCVPAHDKTSNYNIS